MGLKDVLINLNDLKASGIINDYAIGGGYAVIFYDIPLLTYGIDVLVILENEDAFHRLYGHFRGKGAKIENVYIYIGDMPVQFLPDYISPLFRGAVEEANTVEFEGIKSRFVSIEYLILLLLTSFRPKDRIRIRSLTDKASKRLLLKLIERFDDDQKNLNQRYREILAET